MLYRMKIIKEIKNETDLVKSHKLIKESFKTVADDFGLTMENCPANPAFTKYSQLLEMKEEGIKMFGLFLGKQQVGFIAIEYADKGAYYIERLSILPEFRHKGYGTALMDFTFNYVKKAGGERVSVALMDNNILLKNWYIAYGFRETGKKEFDHLPFKVCFMEKEIIS
jgi:ribosomal protein S18 acetylase RimI-like enzyme